MGTVTIGSDTFDVFGTSAGLATYANGSAAYYATYAAANVADANQVKRTHVEATRLIALMPFADAADAVPATASADVATACYELTLAALTDVAVLTQASTAQRVRKVDAKGVSVEFFGPLAGSCFPARVMTLLGPLLETVAASSSTVGAGGYVSGTSTCSDFDTCDAYGLTSA